MNGGENHEGEDQRQSRSQQKLRQITDFWKSIHASILAERANLRLEKEVTNMPVKTNIKAGPHIQIGH